jgi:histidine ammonia-lyase
MSRFLLRHRCMRHICLAMCTAGGLCATPCFASVGAPPAYVPINATKATEAIALDGHLLTIDQIVDVARYGAKVDLTGEARQRQADNYGLLLEATAEGIAVYWFNRATGDQRETVLFKGDATSPANHDYVARHSLEAFQRGALAGFSPEVSQEEVTRAMMVVRANAMTYNAPSHELAQMLLDLLNKGVTPVVRSRGTVGEGDLAQLGNVAGTMVGAGEAYYHGVRMPAAKALALAGLNPLTPFAADENALTSSNAYATGQAALAVYDGERALEWADLIYAMDLNGLNSSITPLSTVVQQDRPEHFLNGDAARILAMVRGSYLFDADPKRIIQDPESMRASSIRQASAWEEWAALRDAVVFQANSSDHNPAVHVGLGPEDSWELASPQMMQFYVKGGPLSHGQHGYIVSNANWDPYPMANKLENFVIALANMDVAVMLRIERFRNVFFTGIQPQDVLKGWHRRDTSGYLPTDLQQEIQGLAVPVAPTGSALETTVEDLQSQTRLKVQRARQAVSTTMDLLGLDLAEAALWLDVRKAQDPARTFGEAPTAAWKAVRMVIPLLPDADHPATESDPMLAARFIRETPAARFFAGERP